MKINKDCEIIRVTEENYQGFSDMVSERMGEKLNEDMEIISKELSNPNLYVFAAQKEDRFVGWISIRSEERRGGKESRL